MIALSHRANITGPQTADINNAMNNPTHEINPLARHSVHSRIFDARNLSGIANQKLNEGEERIDDLNAVNPGQQAAPAAAAPVIHVPKISVPRFSGNTGPKDTPYREWRPLYDALVHNVAAIDPISKLAHLKDCLDFPAKGIGAHLPMTDVGYQARMDLLERRFANDTQELQKAIRSYALLKSGNTSKSLRQFLDKIADLNQTVTMYGAAYNDLPTLTHITDAMDSSWKLRLIEAKNRRPAIPAPAAWDVDEFCRVLETVVRIQEEADTPAHVLYAGNAPVANQGQGGGNAGGYGRRSNVRRTGRPPDPLPLQNFEAVEEARCQTNKRYV
jgi:hypothetical protein